MISSTYDITATELLYAKGMRISDHERLALKEQFAGKLPPWVSIFADDWHHADLGQGVFEWQGEGSGPTYETLKTVLAAFHGEADLLLTWCGGHSHSGLRLRDHAVTEHFVTMKLVQEHTPCVTRGMASVQAKQARLAARDLEETLRRCGYRYNIDLMAFVNTQRRQIISAEYLEAALDSHVIEWLSRCSLDRWQFYFKEEPSDSLKAAILGKIGYGPANSSDR